MTKDIYNMITEERETYASMIDYCCGGQLILNNSISEFEFDNWEELAGSIYDDDNKEYEEIYQYYIITESAALRLAKLTDETVLYNAKLDMYLLAVKHYGTSWNMVPANWKEYKNINKD